MRSAIARRPRALAGGVAVVAVLVGAGACSTASSDTADESARGKTVSGKVIPVVAAENFWGSIAQQLDGSHVHVKSIIDNPATDPHDYEPTAADGRAVATARTRSSTASATTPGPTSCCRPTRATTAPG
ncbi:MULTISPECIES: metal ABC transporter solute-binding protein, Zn/Mn family [Streptomyces]|uniref:metal ABC transporter solute-binding protein, Zn/Mn family n=1 Tax=Streptomyces TaxID=1883 RepID=UPI001FF19299|nr:zinc ABC transporter substrate-binding protein [Streptomyces sp. AgN23]WTB11040.1 zinc ABC transporter substrate-binding protein [Streptomyces antimycoticus]